MTMAIAVCQYLRVNLERVDDEGATVRAGFS